MYVFNRLYCQGTIRSTQVLKVGKNPKCNGIGPSKTHLWSILKCIRQLDFIVPLKMIVSVQLTSPPPPDLPMTVTLNFSNIWPVSVE
jgi:hypothetical protein